MKKMRVLHIAKIDNNKTKGTSVAVPQYVISQCKNDELEVAFLNCCNIKINELENIENIYIASENKNMEVLRKFQPEIVVFHELYKIEYIKIYKFLNKNKIPYIIIPHGGMNINVQNTRKLKKMLGNFLLFNKFFYSAQCIQYLSEAERDKSVYKKINNCIIGNGIPNIPDENKYLKKINSNDLLNLVYVGRYDYLIKGLDQLLESFKILNEEGVMDIKLNLYGKSEKNDYDLIKSYIENNNLNQLINLNGPVFGDEKRNIILNNDAFIQVSRTEGQPLGVMESLSLGMPVILSEGTGYKKIIENNSIGILTKTSSEEIAHAILKIKNRKDKLCEYSKNAYEYALKNYTWESNVDKTINLYKTIIRND